MADLRKAARGRECQVRIPGVCNGNSETSVLAHIRLAGLCGIRIHRCYWWPDQHRKWIQYLHDSRDSGD